MTAERQADRTSISEEAGLTLTRSAVLRLYLPFLTVEIAPAVSRTLKEEILPPGARLSPRDSVSVTPPAAPDIADLAACEIVNAGDPTPELYTIDAPIALLLNPRVDWEQVAGPGDMPFVQIKA